MTIPGLQATNQLHHTILNFFQSYCIPAIISLSALGTHIEALILETEKKTLLDNSHADMRVGREDSTNHFQSESLVTQLES